jgi:hypothetical protein
MASGTVKHGSAEIFNLRVVRRGEDGGVSNDPLPRDATIWRRESPIEFSYLRHQKNFGGE